VAHAVPQTELLWALGSICALHQRPFSAELVEREFPQPCSHATLIRAGRAVGLRIKQVKLKPAKLESMVFPLLVGLAPVNDASEPSPTLGIVTAVADDSRTAFPVDVSGNRATEKHQIGELGHR